MTWHGEEEDAGGAIGQWAPAVSGTGASKRGAGDRGEGDSGVWRGAGLAGSGALVGCGVAGPVGLVARWGFFPYIF